MQLTKDKKVVVCHDNNLERLTGEKKLINQTCYSGMQINCFETRLKVENEVSSRRTKTVACLLCSINFYPCDSKGIAIGPWTFSRK